MEILQTKKLFAAISNTDRCEGRGVEYVFALAEKESTARRLGKGQDVQGCDCRVMEVDAYLVKEDRCFPRWYAPAGFIYQPTNEDLAEEKKAQDELDKKTLIAKFEAGEELTADERKKIIQFLK